MPLEASEMCPITIAKADSRLTKCLNAKRESKSVEFKELFTPTDASQALEVLKDIVAIANSGGGTLAIGINNAGDACGSDVTPVLDYDHAKYCDLIKKYTMQDFADFEVIKAEKDGHSVAIFLINPPDSPLVFEKPGTYPVGNNRQQTAFSKGTIYFRHGAKSESGTTDDLRKFISQRVREMQDQLLKGMRRVETPTSHK
jgi:predicted HTH transcriptional regulator